MVNEDWELVGYISYKEFLVGNSLLVMGPPVQDFAQRAGYLESISKVADRKSVLLYVPELWIGQDLAHLKMCVFETIPHIHPAQADFVVSFREAIWKKKADLQGGVTGIIQLKKVWSSLQNLKFKKMPDLWNKCCTTLKLQNGHIAKGCLIPKHQQLPFTTLNNDSWHNAAASSLTSVLSVLPNIFLRKNLLVKIKNRSQPANSPSGAFWKKVIEASTHHIFLVDRNRRLEEILYSSNQPKLLDAFSKHEFRLVKHESNRYKAKRKELLQTLKPDDIKCPEVIVTAVMNGMVVMNGELPVDSYVEMEVSLKAKPENTHLQHSAISSSCLPEKHMATQLDSEDDATAMLAISSKHPHLNQELLEPDIKPPSIPSIWNFTKSNQFTSSTNIDVETFTSVTGTLFVDYQEKNDKIIHDGLVLKNGLLAIEKGAASHIQRVARGDSIKPFWKLQTTLPPPVKVTYTIPTKKGTLGAVKTYGRCKKQKDGYGEKNTNKHKLDESTSISGDDQHTSFYGNDMGRGKDGPGFDKRKVAYWSGEEKVVIYLLDDVNNLSGLAFDIIRPEIQWIMMKQWGIACFDIYALIGDCIFDIQERATTASHTLRSSYLTGNTLGIDVGRIFEFKVTTFVFAAQCGANLYEIEYKTHGATSLPKDFQNDNSAQLSQRVNVNSGNSNIFRPSS
ncbi:hypothetical protein BT69DRAFT_1299755 [Atractiella rhizophila]|nr:hypothetical protein BT69DRAFT_1299755 [Atractiella rhizophila]